MQVRLYGCLLCVFVFVFSALRVFGWPCGSAGDRRATSRAWSSSLFYLPPPWFIVIDQVYVIQVRKRLVGSIFFVCLFLRWVREQQQHQQKHTLAAVVFPLFFFL